MKRMALVLSYVHNKEIRKAKCHGFMETKTKVDALFNILFYIYHNNGNNTRKKMLITRCTELYGSGTMRVVVCVNLYISLLSHP